LHQYEDLPFISKTCYCSAKPPPFQGKEYVLGLDKKSISSFQLVKQFWHGNAFLKPSKWCIQYLAICWPVYVYISVGYNFRFSYW